MTSKTTDGKPTAQLDLFDNIMRDNTNSNTNISEKTANETNSPMKDSGIEWIGKIPDIWFTVPLRHIATRKSTSSLYDGNPHYIALEQIVSWTGQRIPSDENPVSLGATVSKYTSQDILFGKLRPYLAKVYCPEDEGVCSTELLVLSTSLYKKYLYYVLISKSFIDAINAQSHGIKMPRTNWSDMGRINIPVPPLAEQVAIASRLDSITSRIDEAVRLIDEQLADLKDYRKALISEVVTRGVPSDSTPQPTKPTNTKWIPTIPTHWKTTKLKYCIREISVRNFPVQTRQILSLMKDKGVIRYEDKGDIGNKAKTDITGYKVAYEGDLVVNSMNILIGAVGLSQWTGCVSPAYYVFQAIEGTDLRYINYLMNMREFQKELRKYANGILEIRLRVSSEDIFNQVIPYPSFAEQKAIADYLDTMMELFDTIEHDMKQQRQDLLAYRQSIISEYVTGKRRV